MSSIQKKYADNSEPVVTMEQEDQDGFDHSDIKKEPTTSSTKPTSKKTAKAQKNIKPEKNTEDKAAVKHTPMIEQFLKVKEAHPDCMLFYRMGDFYELFFDDAVKAAETLDITLTKRGKADGDDIPMCGVPHHSHENYLARLIKAGFKVAICEQIETPEEAKKRDGYKALVRRDVVRVVTPGTITEDSLLDTRTNNYLACIAPMRGSYGLSWLDISNGQFYAQTLTQESLFSALSRLHPSEIIIPEKLYAPDQSNEDNLQSQLLDYDEILSILSDSLFDSLNAKERLLELYTLKSLDVLGEFDAPMIAAAGTLIDYARKTQKGSLPYIAPLKVYKTNKSMEIDAATRRNLELSRTMTGERKGSLLSVIDRTITGVGARLLTERLGSPSCDAEEINQRLNQVEFMIGQDQLCDQIRDILKNIPDMERSLSRLSLDRGSPRDLDALRKGLSGAEALCQTLIEALSEPRVTLFDNIVKKLHSAGNTAGYSDRLDQALAEALPFQARDGGFIREGFSAKLDELRGLSKESKIHIAALEQKYRDQTKITSLKIKFNNVLGYFIDIPPKHADALMVGTAQLENNNENPFVHRQTLANAVRFTTAELSDLEVKIMQAGEKSVAIELELYEQLRTEAVSFASHIKEKAESVAELDVACAMAVLANEQNYTKPIVDQSITFAIEAGRHTVVEHSLQKTSEAPFITNDCNLNDDQKLWLLTGPNMAGKSTFLRQNALIAILAQIGSYVPADHAHIGVIDKVFSRVGASDDLARGRSTFMVEMVETATILNQATDRSLVILDEIGRGTATFDGLSIAWGCLEFLHDACQCRGLFATHYHELTTLEGRLGNLSCHRMNVKEWKGQIIFMHQVIKGTADQSYGIHVAKLAGLPSPVVKRAKDILKRLQESEQSGQLAKLSESLPLFEALQDKHDEEDAITHLDLSSKAQNLLENLQPDELSPKAALDWAYALKQAMNEDDSK